jgi:uncharacterized Rossmann fold enzyme
MVFMRENSEWILHVHCDNWEAIKFWRNFCKYRNAHWRYLSFEFRVTDSKKRCAGFRIS